MTVGDQKHLLIVDDEVAVRDPLRLAFEAEGWTVTEAEDFSQALKCISARDYDAVLIDKNLPDRDGLDVARTLRRSHSNVALLIITGYPTVDSAVDGLNLGVDGYIQKPFDDIFAVVERTHLAVSTRVTSRSDPVETTDTPARAPRALIGIPDATIRSTCERWFQARSVEFEVAAAGSALLGALAMGSFDLVMVHVDLAQENITQLVQNIRRGSAQTACVVLCEQPSLDTTVLLIDVGVHALLEGKISASQLEEKVGPLVDKLSKRSAGEADVLSPLADRM